MFFLVIVLLLLAINVHASTLSVAASSLGTGSWSAQITTTNFNNGLAMKPLNNGSILEYTDKQNWNPQNNTVMILGASHPNSDNGLYIQKFMKYTDSNNTWSELVMPGCGGLGPDPSCPPPFPYDTGQAHEYHHATINPNTGDLYHRQYNSNRVMKFAHATQTWSLCTAIPGSTNVAEVLQYFPDRNSLIYIDGDWGIWEMPLASGNCTGSWTNFAGGNGGGSPQFTNISGYHVQGAYSSLCGCILFVGQTSTSMWRFNSNGTIAQVANTPQIPGIPQGGGGAIFTVDPVSQHILMWHNSNAATTMYDYNPTTNAWSTISRGSPMFPGPEGGVTETVAIPIPVYGVIMFVQATSTNSSGQIRLYKHAAGVADTTAPTAPSGLTATPISPSQINLAWTVSTDNVGVTAYLVERCAGASCVNFVQVYSVGANSQNDTSLAANTLYRYRVRATDAAGNLSAYSAIVQATTLTSGGGQTFAQRCAAAGVVLCNGFDVDADRGTVGASSIGTWRGVFRNGQANCNSSDANRCPTIDTTTSASGGGSLKFVVPSNSDSGGSGQFFTNASSDMSTRFGSGQTFYMQVRMRFSCDFLFTNCPAGTGVRVFAGGGGWKTVDISQADRTATCFPGSLTCATSCSELEIVVQNTNTSGFVQGYHGCPGTYQGSSFVFEQQAGSEFYRQNAYAGLCPRSEVIVGNLANCFTYKMNEWMTFKARVSIGTFVAGGTGACATFSQGCYPNSIVEYWMGREGQPLVKTHSFTFTLNASFDGTQTEKWGKFWLLPYNTSKDSTVSNPEAYLWYDELVISTQDIADPAVVTDTTNPTVAITNPIPPTSSSTTSPIAVSGTAADNVSVTSVTWTCIQCVTKGGTATSSPGTSISWTIPTLDLVSGTNTLNMVSHDAAGNVSTAATLTITYTPVTTYWVRPTGTMSGCTASGTAPTTDAGYKSTITAGVNCLAAGGRLIIRAGTYNERLDEEAGGITYPRATSWAGASIIEAMAGETVTVLPTAQNGNAVLRIASTSTNYYLWFMGHNRNFIIDGTNVTTGQSVVKIQAPFVRLDSMEIRNGQTQNGGNGVIVVDPSTGVEILNNNIHNNGIVGDVNGQSYGIYAQSPNTIITGNDIHDNTGYGIQIYKSGGNPTNNTFANNRVYNNGCTTNIGGVLIQGTSHKVYNNLIYSNCGRPLEAYFSGDETGTVFYNNTLYGNINADFALFLNNGVTARNNISSNNAGTLVGNGTGSVTADHNLCSSTCEFGSSNVTDTAANTFVNAAAGNFHLGPNAFAKDQGVSTLGSPYNVDFDGLPRTSPWDIGAYEFVASGTSPVVTIVNPTSNPTLSVSLPTFSLGGTSNLP
jgi:hypothetical protein